MLVEKIGFRWRAIKCYFLEQGYHPTEAIPQCPGLASHETTATPPNLLLDGQ